MAKPEPKHDAVTAVIWASVSSLCLGVGLTLRGLSPLFVHRIVTGELPSAEILSVQSTLIAVGGVFIGISLLLKRCVAPAAWAGFLLAMLLAGGGIGAAFLVGASVTDIFLFVLCVIACGANMLAIGALSAAAQAAQNPPAARGTEQTRATPV